MQHNRRPCSGAASKYCCSLMVDPRAKIFSILAQVINKSILCHDHIDKVWQPCRLLSKRHEILEEVPDQIFRRQGADYTGFAKAHRTTSSKSNAPSGPYLSLSRAVIIPTGQQRKLIVRQRFIACRKFCTGDRRQCQKFDINLSYRQWYKHIQYSDSYDQTFGA